MKEKIKYNFNWLLVIGLVIIVITLVSLFILLKIEFNPNYIIKNERGKTIIDPECALWFINGYDCFDINYRFEKEGVK